MNAFARLTNFPLRATTLTLMVTLGTAACTTTATQPPISEDKTSAVLPSGNQQTRITDTVIRTDLQYLEGLQSRIRSLNDKGTAVQSYGLAKAQCWLNWALDEYHDNDRTGVIDEAALESRTLIEALELGAAIDPATRIVKTSTRVREDLWARVDAVKRGGSFGPPHQCANAITACLEVKLVEAGHDLQETGWRHARPTIGEAEQMAAAAEAELATCGGAPVVNLPSDQDNDRDGIANSMDECPNSALGARVDARGCDLQGAVPLRFEGVNFANNSATLTADSNRALDEAAQTLKRYPDLNIEVQGHTDSRGSDAHNQALSERRAIAVMEYLKSAGVTNALTAKGYGESQPIATNETDEGRAENRRVVLRIVQQ